MRVDSRPFLFSRQKKAATFCKVAVELCEYHTEGVNTCIAYPVCVTES